MLALVDPLPEASATVEDVFGPGESVLVCSKDCVKKNMTPVMAGWLLLLTVARVGCTVFSGTFRSVPTAPFISG